MDPRIQKHLRTILLSLLKDVEELIVAGGVVNHERLNSWLDNDVMSFRQVDSWEKVDDVVEGWCLLWVEIQQHENAPMGTKRKQLQHIRQLISRI